MIGNGGHTGYREHLKQLYGKKWALIAWRAQRCIELVEGHGCDTIGHCWECPYEQ